MMRIISFLFYENKFVGFTTFLVYGGILSK